MLEQGLKTAHNAYTQESFIQAQVLADTPIFCDYQALDKHFSNSKFIYLTRKAELWIPSIKQLLQRMMVNLQRTDGGFNPHLKRCYSETFAPLTLDNVNRDDFLLDCYNRHQQGVFEYFKDRQQDLLTIDVSDDDSYLKLLTFLNIDNDKAREGGFKQINIGGKVRAWQHLNNDFKVESTNKGRIDKKLY
ncbi:sulfotransferase family protein [Colwellia sp. E2M01]|nr:sulfotransferase [Colwellia sp. E2M01]MBU2871062.1 sulfotransferase family protein [Colwellia sp. E2M01]